MGSSKVASKSAVLGIAVVGTVLAFVIGAQAGALLNGRVMNQSVGAVPMPVMGSAGSSPVHTHVR
ncbi:MAG: hypothetical protein KIT84_36925 [Labilithrix sp.]|nr:hypothetical protein [Labilithrix sp.]MCW5816641.1 hypothetical protein [Labilithrix sp.]